MSHAQDYTVPPLQCDNIDMASNYFEYVNAFRQTKAEDSVCYSLETNAIMKSINLILMKLEDYKQSIYKQLLRNNTGFSACCVDDSVPISRDMQGS